jgi:hypothetical protein
MGGDTKIIGITKNSVRVDISIKGPHFMKRQGQIAVYITVHEFKLGEFYHFI